ncbi:MAG TPA: HAD-IB family hydrolase [Acidimicrobiia bacterium]
MTRQLREQLERIVPTHLPSRQEGDSRAARAQFRETRPVADEVSETASRLSRARTKVYHQSRPRDDGHPDGGHDRQDRIGRPNAKDRVSPLPNHVWNVWGARPGYKTPVRGYLEIVVAAAFFDLDKTIIAKSSTLAFTRPMFKAGLLSGSTLAKAGIAQAYYQAFGADHDQLERMREELSAMTKGWDRAEIEALVTETVDEVVTPLVYAEALAVMDEHRGSGRRVVVVSASPEEIVRPLCRHLGIDDVIATRAAVDEEGRYTGDLELYAYGEGKAEAIHAMAEADGIDLGASYAYSDSITDLPMMEAVGHPVAVNPDSELRAIAEERGWPIRKFESTVTLRDKLPTIAASGAVATGIAAILAYWALKGRRSS